MSQKQLVEELVTNGVLKTTHIIDAFLAIDRADFVPDKIKASAHINAPLPIGHGQTISQPLTVAFMLELLQPQPQDKILDIGSGSGWQTALLAHIVGPDGKVVGLETIPELHRQSIINLAQYKFINRGIVQMHRLNAKNGFAQEAPFDKIIAAAALQGESPPANLDSRVGPRPNGRAALGKKIPPAWKDQLKINGRLVTPRDNSLLLLIKQANNSWQQKEFPGFAFVPFVEK